MMKFRQSETRQEETRLHTFLPLCISSFENVSVEWGLKQIRVSSLKRKLSQDVKNNIGEIRNQPVAAEDRLSRKHGS